MKHKTLSFLLTLLMSVAASVVSAHDFEKGGIHYKITSSTAPLTVAVTYRGSTYYEYSNEYTGSVTIPGLVTYGGQTYSVTSIGTNAFRDCSGLTSISIPESVTTIGTNAFRDCSGLTSISIPESVTSIGGTAFRGCSGLTSVTINSNAIASKSYSSSSTLAGIFGSQVTEYVFGSNVQTVGQYACYNCSSLRNVTIGNGVTSIGDYAFYECSSLTSVTIPNSVTSIGDYAFYECSSLTSVAFNARNCTYCGSYSNPAFPSNITTLTIGNEVKTIPSDAFIGCSGLTSVTIPNSVTSIGSDAFYGCSGLTKAEFASIEYYLNGISFSGGFGSSSNPLSYAHHLYIGGSEVTNLVIPENVTSIGSSAFKNCSGLTSVTIPESVTSIGSSAFKNCSGLTSVTIPESVTSIGDSAFSGCSGLTSVTIPESVTSIGSSAFKNCSGLTSVAFNARNCTSCGSAGNPAFPPNIKTLVIGNEVKTIPAYAFYRTSINSVTIGTGVQSIGSDALGGGCKKVIWLTNTPPEGYKNAAGRVNYVPNNQYTSLSTKTVYPYLSSLFEVGGVRYVPVSPSERTCDVIDCQYNESTKNVNIGATVVFNNVTMNVKKVHSYALYENTAINNLQVGNQGNVEDYAFYGCTGLTTVRISNQGYIGNSAFRSSKINGTLSINNTGDINPYAFYGNEGTFTVEMGNNVTAIKESAFSQCTNLQAVKFGSKISYIGEYAFSINSSLQGIVIPNSVTEIGSRAFGGCSKMSSVKMGTGIKTINSYAFSGCTSMTDMQIGKNVNVIGTNVFEGCSSLSKITIPNAVASIGDYAFSGCTTLKEVIMEEKASEIALGRNGNKPLFADCPLDSVYIGRNISYPTSSDNGYSPFYRNTSLRSIHISNVETEVSPNEFYGCTNLKNVRLGDGITKIGDWAFSGCSSIDYFLFGLRTRSIGKEAFSDCTAMTRLVSRAAVPPTCGNQALDDINKWTCTLTVPQGRTAAYQAAAQWKEFFYMEEGDAVPMADEKIKVTLSANGYATFYSSFGNYALPSDLIAKVVTNESNSKLTYKTIADGSNNANVVPAGVPVMLEHKTKQGGNYTLTLSEKDYKYTGTNLLDGTDEAITIQPAKDEYVYKLSYGPSGTEYSKLFGWYWGAVNGGAFQIAANRAWLRVKKANAVKSYILNDETTGIDHLGNEEPEQQTCYDLQGRRVYQPNRKGIYIVNGKKIIKK